MSILFQSSYISELIIDGCFSFGKTEIALAAMFIFYDLLESQIIKKSEKYCYLISSYVPRIKNIITEEVAYREKMYVSARIKYWILSRNLMDNVREKVKYLFILEEES